MKKILCDLQSSLIQYNDPKNIIICDQFGYKYKANYSNLKARKSLPHKFKNNPFVIENIKLYLKQIKSPLKLLSNEYHNCKHKMLFSCIKHPDKIQEKSLDDIIQQNGKCKFCSNELIGERCRISTDIIIHRCNELNLEYVGRFIKNQETHVKFICNHHISKGVQEISWYHLKTAAIGCPYCTGRYKSTEDFISEMESINPDIEIIGEYKGSEEPITVKCRICGHIWSPIGRSLKNKEGCPACTMSRGERRIKKYLDTNSIEYTYQKTFDNCRHVCKLPFDFYLNDFETLIEYDGEQHFYPVDFSGSGHEWAEKKFQEILQRDQVKTEFCADNNIKLIRIPYFEYENIEDILSKEIKIVS